MKVVFIASIAGKDFLEENYRMISGLYREKGYDVFDDYIFKYTAEVLAKSSRASLKKAYKIITAKIKQCDFVVVESTQSSLGVGRYIGVALQYHKPILVLYTNYPPRALSGDPTRLITTKKYSSNDKKGLEEIIEQFAKQAEKKIFTYRFNLMLSHEINNYLLYRAKENSMSKADYVRNLIVSDMNSKDTEN